MSIKKIVKEFANNHNTFTPTEKMIYEQIIKNEKNILNMQVQDISDLVPCNHGSVSRFMKKVCFKSWKDFIISCIFEEKVESKIGINSIQEKIFLEIANAQTTLQAPEIREKIKEIVNVLNGVNKNLILYGHRLSGNIAQYLTWIFTTSNLFATHTYFLDELFGLLKPNSILMVFSDQQGREECIRAVKKARLLGATVIVVNIDKSKEIADIAHITLEVPQLSYFIDYEHSNILKKELLRHIGLVIWEEWQKTQK